MPRDTFGGDVILGVGRGEDGADHATRLTARATMCLAPSTLMSDTNAEVLMIPKVRLPNDDATPTTGGNTVCITAHSFPHRQAFLYEKCTFATREIMRRNCREYVHGHNRTRFLSCTQRYTDLPAALVTLVTGTRWPPRYKRRSKSCSGIASKPTQCVTP